MMMKDKINTLRAVLGTKYSSATYIAGVEREGAGLLRMVKSSEKWI